MAPFVYEIILYADDKTLYAEIASPSERTNVSNSLNRGLAKIQSWCSMWGMKVNPRKTHSITISQSMTPHPTHLPLTCVVLPWKLLAPLGF